jgi:cytochrome c peroxidase
MSVKSRARARFGARYTVFVILASFATGGPAKPNGDRITTLLLEAQGIFRPLPKNMATSEFPVTRERVDLGRKLFFESRVSVDGTVSCARCHQPALYGTDGLSRAHGARNELTSRNAPTVLNGAIQFRAHWIGDREGVEDQATQSLIGPKTFGNPDFASAMARIKAIPGYREMFGRAFPNDRDPVTPDNWGRAIGSYERTLFTPSRFDEYLCGKAGALSAIEQTGLRRFISVGCADCHDGAGIGGGEFRKFGVVENYWKETHSTQIDKGRFEVTHDLSDTYKFKVPSLRNVAMTSPYFHDGSVARLPRVVRIMARVQLGKTLADEDVRAIVAFLGSLTGKLPEDFLTAPVLPAVSLDESSP